MAEVVQGKTCSECGAPIDLAPNRPTSTRVYGRNYRWRNVLNKVFKCVQCGNIFSWKEEET